MAGVPAGRLSIEIVADIARLQTDLDKAKRAVSAASKDLAGSARAANDNISRMGGSSRLAGHHMQNLSFQLQDIVIGLKGGQRPMTVFMQQGSQIAQIMTQAGVGVGGLSKAIGSMALNFARAHPILLGVTAVLGGVAIGVNHLTSELTKRGEIDKFVKGLGLSKDELKKLEGQSVTAMDVVKGLWRTFDEVTGVGEKISWLWNKLKDLAADAGSFVIAVIKNAAAAIYAGFAGAIEGVGILFRQLPNVIGEGLINTANFVLRTLDQLVNASIGLLNDMISGVNGLFGTNLGMIAETSFGQIENSFAGSAERMGADLSGAFQGAFSDAMNWMDDFASRADDNILAVTRERLMEQAAEIIADRDEKSAKAKKKALSELEKAYKKAKEAADEYLKQLLLETERIGKNAIQLKRMEIADKAAAAAKFGLLTEYRKIIDAGRELIGVMQREADMRFDTLIKSIKDEISLIGKVGPAREFAALALEEEGFKAKAAADGISDVEAAWRRYLAVRTEQINKESALERDLEAAERINDQLREMTGLLQGIGGFAGVLGGLMDGLLTNNFSGLGAPGQLLNILLAPQEDLAKQVDLLAKGLDDIFGIGGSFGKTLAQALQGAAIGSTAASAVFGQNGTNAGSAIGGALGSIAGDAFSEGITKAATSAFGKTLGGILGSAVPVVGGIVGGIIGNLVGGLFGGSNKGVIGITGSSSGFSTFSTKHGSAEQLAAATQAATGMFDALGNIAQQLGGTLNAGAAGRLSLGMRDDDWVLDPTGQGRTKGTGVINFGPDQEAAVKAAMKLLIDRGVIGGIRESTQRLLSNASDLEQGLQDALAFEGVFKALEAQANPFASALRQLGQEMEYLEGVFQRAGATAEEYAQLQEFIAMQQQALIDQASANYRSTFYTDAENVAFAKQTISSTLTPMGYGDVDTVAEYKALVEATDALADPELYGALMELSDEFGVLKDAADQAKAAAEAEAAAKKAEAEARKNAFENELRQAWQRERSELERTADAYRGHAENLRNWRMELIAGSDATLGYEQRLAKLRSTFQMARLGDETALGGLQGAGNDFLSSARGQATSLVDYQRAVSMVARMAEDAARSADGMATEAERQIALLDQQVGKLIDIDQGIKTVAELLGGSGGGRNVDRQQRQFDMIQRLLDRGVDQRFLSRMIERYESQYGSFDVNSPPSAGDANMGGGFSDIIASLNGRLERQQRTLDRMDQRWERMTANDGVGIIIRNDPDIPLNTVAA